MEPVGHVEGFEFVFPSEHERDTEGFKYGDDMTRFSGVTDLWTETILCPGW